MKRLAQPHYLAGQVTTPFGYLCVRVGIKIGLYDSTLHVNVGRIQVIFKSNSYDQSRLEGRSKGTKFSKKPNPSFWAYPLATNLAIALPTSRYYFNFNFKTISALIALRLGGVVDQVKVSVALKPSSSRFMMSSQIRRGGEHSASTWLNDGAHSTFSIFSSGTFFSLFLSISTEPLFFPITGSAVNAA